MDLDDDDDVIDPTRRRFVQELAAGTAVLGGGLALAACGGGGPGAGSSGGGGGSGGDGGFAFTHGVASGDPLADRVLLWTRAAPGSAAVSGSPTLTWEVATDNAFANVVRSGSTSTSAAQDYTVKVDATGLAPATVYYYRFSLGGQRSATGRTKTLPSGNVARVKLAVLSCANYPAGYFNVYAEAALQADLDAVLHLGDYIYEYGRSGDESTSGTVSGREVDPANETLTLADYRQRYAQNRSDPDLRALHAALPMIAVWDDHEFANDAWSGGAGNHDPATEGSFTARRAAAVQAYHEWLPIRLTDTSQPDRIYRSFDFGNLMSLHMLDTRLIGRDKQLAYARYTTAAGFDTALFNTEVNDASRQLLGTTQSAWLASQMAASRATWQVLGQQVLMARMNLPAPVVTQQIGIGAYLALLAQAAAAPITLTAAQRALLAQPSVPLNLDAWDGYAAAREQVLNVSLNLGKNLVSLAGDTHNAWANDLRDAAGNAVGVEFATASVSSPGLERVVNEAPAAVAAGLRQFIGPLAYADTSRRGLLLLTVTPSEVRADWRFVSSVASRSYVATTERSLRVLPGAGQRRIVEV